MPSAYVPPDVYVEQRRRSAIGTPRPPNLPVVVVGPAVQIVARGKAGDYDARIAAQVPFPGLSPGGIVDADTVEVLLQAKSDSGRPLGTFVLNTSEFEVLSDTDDEGRPVPYAVRVDSNLALELSQLSLRNNDLIDGNEDFGSATPNGIEFRDTAVDFLARGASVDGGSFIVISQPSSMAGAYVIIGMIPTGNNVFDLLIEKVRSDDYDVAELIHGFTIDGTSAPVGSAIRGMPATHESVVYDAATNNVSIGNVPGVGVSEVLSLQTTTGLQTLFWGTAELSAILSASGSTGAGNSLRLPGRGSSATVEFGPADVSTGAPDTILRQLPLWRDMLGKVQVGDWMRASYVVKTPAGPDAISGINYSTGVVTFTTAAFVQSNWVGRELQIAGNGDVLNNRSYEIVAVNTVANSVTVDLTPYGGAFPGTASATFGNGTVVAQPAVLRDFKIVGIDTVNYSVILSAQGGQSTPDDVFQLASDGLDRIEFFKVLRGRLDAPNAAGDTLTFTLGGAAYRREVLSATPTLLTTVSALPSFAALEVNEANGEIEATSDFAAANPVIVLDVSTTVQASWGAGHFARITNQNDPDNNGLYPIISVSTLNNSVTIDVSVNSNWNPSPAIVDGDVEILRFEDLEVITRRGVPFRNSSATYDLRRRLVDGYVADILVSYRAERRDLPLNGLMELSSRVEIEQMIGQIHPDNPLALGCDMIVRSGLADGARTFYALAINGDNLAAHLEAMDTLEIEDVYFIVPLTQDPAIISAYKAHVGVQSQPRNRHERVVMVSTALPTQESVLPTAGEPAPSGTFLTVTSFSAPGANLGLVNPGDMLKILLNGEDTVEIERRILSVNPGAGIITLLSGVDTSYVGETRTFKVDTYPLTRTEQAEAWRDYSASLRDFRVMVIRPDQVEITFTDKTLAQFRDRRITVGGEYACCAFAGLCASLPVESPMTNVPVPGIDRLVHSNGYFKPAELDTIAEGGNNILVQETRTSVPYSRHQLTTDMTSIITREFSITKIVDFSAKFVRNSLRPFIGNRNITREYLTQLRGTTEAVLRALVRSEVLLPATEVLSLRQNPDEPDSILIEIAVAVPYPANRIFVTLFV